MTSAASPALNAKQAQEVIDLYAKHHSTMDGGARPEYAVVDGDEQKELGINDAQRAALNKVMSDGVVNDKEKEALKQNGFSDEFVQTLAGQDGQAALKKRVVWLSGQVGRGLFGAGDVKQRFRDTMELRAANREIKSTDGMSKGDVEDVQEGLGKTKELTQDLASIAEDKSLPIEKRMEAIRELAALDTPDAQRKVISYLDDSTLHSGISSTVYVGVYRAELVGLLGNMSLFKNSDIQAKALEKLVNVLDNSNDSVAQRSALDAINKISLKAIDADKPGWFHVMWAMDHVKRFAENSTTGPDERKYALIALANSGFMEAATPGLYKLVEAGTDKKTVELSQKNADTLAGPQPQQKNGEGYKQYDERVAIWRAGRDAYQSQIERAQKAVSDGKDAQEALTRLQKQLEDQTRVIPQNRFSTDSKAMTLLT